MKKWLSLLACLLLVCTLTGCGNKSEDKKETSKNNNVVVDCKETEEGYDEEVDSETEGYIAEYDKSGKLVKFTNYYEIKLKTADKDMLKEYRTELEEECEYMDEEKYKNCKVTVSGKIIRGQVEFNMKSFEEDGDIPTKEEFIEELEDEGMTCTVK